MHHLGGLASRAQCRLPPGIMRAIAGGRHGCVMPPTDRFRRPWSARGGGVSSDNIRLLARTLLVGLVLGFFLRTGWPMPVGPTLLMGSAITLWALATFATEQPND
jgi:hypothetical protein